ncbi:MAG: type IV pilus modification protein PilV [candidate division NC10 bacterium]|nr:type IV pilus modification protein PilV [candidate division NC10 bacterium]
MAGLTLVEFLFAVSITAIAGLGVAGMFPAALRSVVTGGQTTKATVLAQEMADMIRADTFAKAVDYNGTDTTSSFTCTSSDTVCNNKLKWKNDLVAATAQETGKGLPNGKGTVSVACVNPDGTSKTCDHANDDLRRVTVTVMWDREGSRSVSLVTYVARNE